MLILVYAKGCQTLWEILQLLKRSLERRKGSASTPAITLGQGKGF